MINTKILSDSTEGGQVLEKFYDELYTILNQITKVIPNGKVISPVVR